MKKATREVAFLVRPVGPGGQLDRLFRGSGSFVQLFVQGGNHRDVDQFPIEFTHDEGFGKPCLLHVFQSSLGVEHGINRLRHEGHLARLIEFLGDQAFQ